MKCPEVESKAGIAPVHICGVHAHFLLPSALSKFCQKTKDNPLSGGHSFPDSDWSQLRIFTGCYYYFVHVVGGCERGSVTVSLLLFPSLWCGDLASPVFHLQC